MPKGVYHGPWEKSFDLILTPLEEFIHRQTTSGILLMICAVIALVIANSPLHEAYEHFLHEELAISFGNKAFSLSIHHWINEALMAMFFFIMGLELKRELLVGELSTPSQASLPIMAAIGGMLIPALGYFIFNTSGPEAKGWGIPMATDIAFAIGALSLLGPRIPKNLITFLIALAIVDDLGAVAVIALFYTDSIDTMALFYAAVMTFVLLSFNLGGVRRPMPYAVVGILLWTAMLASGIHATIAGIIVAFVIPIRPKFPAETFIARVEDSTREMKKSVAENPDIIHNNRFRSLVMSMGDGVKLGMAKLPEGLNMKHILGVGLLGGIGFTMSIFIADLGFAGKPEELLAAKTGILLASAIAGFTGFFWLKANTEAP